MKWDKRFYRILVSVFLLLASWDNPMRPSLYAQSISATSSAPTKKNKYQRSRTTSDESEGVADKRNLLLTTGEDKTVDVDFDIHVSNGINVGNPQIVGFTLAKVGEKRQLIFKP